MQSTASHIAQWLPSGICSSLEKGQKMMHGLSQAQLSHLVTAPPSPEAVLASKVLLCFRKWTPSVQTRLSRNSAQHNIKVVRICLRQWSCLLVLQGTVVTHKTEPSLIYLQEEHLGSGSVMPWVQTPTECLYSDSFSGLIHRLLQASESPYICWHAQHSHQPARVGSNLQQSNILDHNQLWVCIFKPFSSNQFSSRQNAAGTSDLAFLDSTPGTFQAWITDRSRLWSDFSLTLELPLICIQPAQRK